MIMKLVKLRATLDHPQMCIFKIFFNHGEGIDDETSQMESHSSASSNTNVQNFPQPWSSK